MGKKPKTLNGKRAPLLLKRSLKTSQNPEGEDGPGLGGERCDEQA